MNSEYCLIIIPFKSLYDSIVTTFEMRVISKIKDLRSWRLDEFYNKKSLGFVPTMGALHEGHLKLVRESLKQNESTLVSIFVNPSQFAPNEDLNSYPRTLNDDMKKLNNLSNDITIFTPNVLEMYPNGIEQDTSKQVGAFVELVNLSHKMEGKSRPQFFRGVATIVTKLFNVVQPNYAYFGQKDIQQALIIKRLLTDLLFQFPSKDNLKIIETARDPLNNLALSSRNTYLNEHERSNIAPLLFRALNKGKSTFDNGVRDRKLILESMNEIIKEAEHLGANFDYIELNDASTFDVVDNINENGAILSGAMYINKTRLIDNVLLGLEIN